MRTLGRYEIIEQIGAGAMGIGLQSHRSHDGPRCCDQDNPPVAIEGPNASEFREPFFREAKAAGRLVHPGIVTVHDVSEFEVTPFSKEFFGLCRSI